MHVNERESSPRSDLWTTTVSRSRPGDDSQAAARPLPGLDPTYPGTGRTTGIRQRSAFSSSQAISSATTESSNLRKIGVGAGTAVPGTIGVRDQAADVSPRR